MVLLTDDDRVLIRILRTDKGLNAYQMIREFPKRGWTRRTVERLIKQIDETGQSCSKQHERKRTVRTPANISLVLDLICSQDEAPGTSKSPREIQRETGISRSSIQRIAKKDLNLKVSADAKFSSFRIWT